MKAVEVTLRWHLFSISRTFVPSQLQMKKRKSVHQLWRLLPPRSHGLDGDWLSSFFAVLVSLVLLLRGSRTVRVYTAERLAGREIGIVEIEDDDDQNVPLRRLPRALPAPATDNDFIPRFLPARMSDSIRGADIVYAPAQLV